MRHTLILVLAMALAACGDSQGCGGGSDYTYPREDIDAVPTRHAVRMRITETGLAALAAGIPALIAAGCEGNATDGSAACAMDPDPAHSDRVRFYVPSDTTSPASYLAMDLDTMAGNIHVTLSSEGDGAGALEVTLGCNAPQISACNDKLPSDEYTYADDFIYGALDMVVYPVWGAACFVNEDPPPGFVIRSLRFDMRPHIELGIDLKPYLVLAKEDVTVLGMDVELNVLIGAETSDPACLTDVFLLGNVCDAECTALGWGGAFVEFLFETNIIDELLVETVADLALQQLADQALEGEGAIDLGQLLPVGNPRATPAGYLFSAAVAEPGANPPVYSPSVTGNTDNLGWNFDFDTGFAADHGPCVPLIKRAPFVSPRLPELGSQVEALDPVTGEPTLEDFDLAVVLADVVLQRAAHEMFDSGGLCMNIRAETVGEGSFAPTVALVSLLAPGLSELAPDIAPVNLVLSPRYPPVIELGSGDLVGEDIDSHLKITWPELWIDLYPLVDDSHLRALTFTVDLYAGASVEAKPDGGAALMIDRLELVNVAEVYNEMTAPFDADGLEALLGLFLPLILTGEPTEMDLNTEALGLPFVPKLRAVEQVGTGGDFLAAFMRFCNGDAIGDPQNALCYEPPATNGSTAGAGALAVQWLAGPDTGPGISTVRVAAFSDMAIAAQLQLAYRVDSGPWFSFRGPDADGAFSLRHPRLAVPGNHRMEVVARHRWQPYRWSGPYVLEIDVEPRPIAASIPATIIVPVAESVAVSEPVVTDDRGAETGCNSAGHPPDDLHDLHDLRLALLGLALVPVGLWRRRRSGTAVL